MQDAIVFSAPAFPVTVFVRLQEQWEEAMSEETRQRSLDAVNE